MSPGGAVGGETLVRASALELLAQRAEEDLRGLANQVGVRAGQLGRPVRTGALRRLLLELQDRGQQLLVALDPGQPVLLCLSENLLTQLLNPLRRGLDVDLGCAHPYLLVLSREVGLEDSVWRLGRVNLSGTGRGSLVLAAV